MNDSKGNVTEPAAGRDETAVQADVIRAARELKARLKTCEYLLIGLGFEWKKEKMPDVKRAYESLYQLAGEKDYFIVTTVTDAKIFGSPFDASRITAPCGNDTWRQCGRACTRDIWEENEIPEGLCPHCGALLVPNTIQAGSYIEEGYLPRWNAYKEWLSRTLNRELLVLELGVGFQTPTVIRWPFEKTVFFNQKSHMYRVNSAFSQLPEEIRDRAGQVPANSVEFIEKCVGM